MATDLREKLRHWTTASLIDTYVRLRLSGPQQATKVALRRLGATPTPASTRSSPQRQRSTRTNSAIRNSRVR
jgi:hypothetical protein